MAQCDGYEIRCLERLTLHGRLLTIKWQDKLRQAPNIAVHVGNPTTTKSFQTSAQTPLTNALITVHYLTRTCPLKNWAANRTNVPAAGAQPVAFHPPHQSLQVHQKP